MKCVCVFNRPRSNLSLAGFRTSHDMVDDLNSALYSYYTFMHTSVHAPCVHQYIRMKMHECSNM